MKRIIALVLALVASTAVAGVNIPIRNPSSGGSISTIASKARTYLATNQTVVPTTYTTVLFDAKSFDTNTEFDIVTNKGRFTSKHAGFYFVDCKLTINGNTGQAGSAIAVFKTGTRVINSQIINAGTSNPNMLAIGVLSLAVGDYLECKYYNNDSANHVVDANGGTDPGNTYFEVIELP